MEGAGLRAASPLRPRPAPARGRVGSACLGHMSCPPASPGRPPAAPAVPAAACRPLAAHPPGSSGCLRCAVLRCLRPGLGRGPRRSRPPRPAPVRPAPARAMGRWLPPPPAPPG